MTAGHVPHGTVFLTFVCTAILALFPLASTIALNIVTSFQLGSMALAYLICIVVLMDSRFRKDQDDQNDTYFPLPRWTVTIANAGALVFLVLAVVLLCFPAAPKPTAKEMNWTCVMLPGFIFCALVYYYIFGGQSSYKGPIHRLRISR